MVSVVCPRRIISSNSLFALWPPTTISVFVEYLFIRSAASSVRYSGRTSETFDIQKQTIQIIEQLVDKGAIPRIHHFIPLAGTPYYSEHPADVHIEHRKRIGQLMLAGKVRGSFEFQRKLALSVVNFLQTWKIQNKNLK